MLSCLNCVVVYCLVFSCLFVVLSFSFSGRVFVFAYFACLLLSLFFVCLLCFSIGRGRRLRSALTYVLSCLVSYIFVLCLSCMLSCMCCPFFSAFLVCLVHPLFSLCSLLLLHTCVVLCCLVFYCFDLSYLVLICVVLCCLAFSWSTYTHTHIDMRFWTWRQLERLQGRRHAQ